MRRFYPLDTLFGVVFTAMMIVHYWECFVDQQAMSSAAIAIAATLPPEDQGPHSGGAEIVPLRWELGMLEKRLEVSSRYGWNVLTALACLMLAGLYAHCFKPSLDWAQWRLKRACSSTVSSLRRLLSRAKCAF